MGKAALKSHMEGARHQRRVRDSAKSVPIARSFASVEETSQVAPKTFTNDSVMEGLEKVGPFSLCLIYACCPKKSPMQRICGL